jgi:HD-GYP domain-containing protein (c-di-GMP phosphodiesterase class II)
MCAGLLHDIGKVAIPDAILRKPGPLTEEELRLMQTHTTVGRRILEGLPPMRTVARVVEQHHERFDGSGYPHALKGKEILLPARIISVVDAFDAMTSTRPYRRALGRDKAVEELRAGAGSQFDPDVVRVFLQYVLAVPPA